MTDLDPSLPRLHPIPETAEAFRELDAWGGGSELSQGLLRLAEAAQEVVPALVGVSLSRLDYGLTFTVVASNELFALLDAIQYIDGGPCVEALASETVTSFDNTDILDEERWRLFAEATASHNVRSTLTLPLSVDGADAGSVNLYASTRHGFTGHHDQLAEIFGAWATHAVANADLSFTTYHYAQATPDRIRDLTVINEAVGLLAAEFDLDIEAAEARLFDAAARAGVTAGALARCVLKAHTEGM